MEDCTTAILARLAIGFCVFLQIKSRTIGQHQSAKCVTIIGCGWQLHFVSWVQLR